MISENIQDDMYTHLNIYTTKSEISDVIIFILGYSGSQENITY